jgi:hypothetical protein
MKDKNSVARFGPNLLGATTRAIALTTAASLLGVATMSLSAQGAEPHGWLNTWALKTRSGDFDFNNGNWRTSPP